VGGVTDVARGKKKFAGIIGSLIGAAILLVLAYWFWQKARS